MPDPNNVTEQLQSQLQEGNGCVFLYKSIFLGSGAAVSAHWRHSNRFSWLTLTEYSSLSQLFTLKYGGVCLSVCVCCCRVHGEESSFDQLKIYGKQNIFSLAACLNFFSSFRSKYLGYS